MAGDVPLPFMGRATDKGRIRIRICIPRRFPPRPHGSLELVEEVRSMLSDRRMASVGKSEFLTMILGQRRNPWHQRLIHFAHLACRSGSYENPA